MFNDSPCVASLHFGGWNSKVKIKVKDAKLPKSFLGHNSSANGFIYFKLRPNVQIPDAGIPAVPITADFLVSKLLLMVSLTIEWLAPFATSYMWQNHQQTFLPNYKVFSLCVLLRLSQCSVTWVWYRYVNAVIFCEIWTLAGPGQIWWCKSGSGRILKIGIWYIPAVDWLCLFVICLIAKWCLPWLRLGVIPRIFSVGS